MGYRIIAEEYVWRTYYEIPDQRDREEALLIIRSLVDNPRPQEAEPNVWEDHLGNLWSGYSIDLSSGRGFIPYAPIDFDDPNEEDAIRLWPLVWGDL